MASELGRTLKIGAEEAEERLLHLSPFQTKNLLLHIMSGQDFEVNVAGSHCSITSCVSNICISNATTTSNITNSAKLGENENGDTSDNDHRDGHFISGDMKAGLWKRRRLLNGCLNRFVTISSETLMISVLLIEFPRIFTTKCGRCSSGVRDSLWVAKFCPTASPRR